VIPRLRFTVAEAAEALGISRSMVENIIRENGLTVHADTPGGHRYISHHSLEKYILEREEMPVFGRRASGSKR
jgi:excisionase family DNA binding protein